MDKKSVFFEPYTLALWKGVIYFLAYCSAVILTDAVGSGVYFEMMLYCLGCCCEYLEIGFYAKKKKETVKNVSVIIFLLTVILSIVFCLISYNYNTDNGVVSFFDNYLFWIKLLLGGLFAIPLINGICGAFTSNSKKSRKSKNKKQGHDAAGTKVKP